MLGNAPIAFELWDGTGAAPETTAPDLVARVEIRDRKTLHSLLTGGDVAFGDSLTEGRIHIHGDQVAFAEALIRWLEDAAPLGSWKRRLLMLSGGRRRYGPADSRSNVQRHYDIGNDFFRLWVTVPKVNHAASATVTAPMAASTTRSCGAVVTSK